MKHTQTHRWLAASLGALTLAAAQAQTATPADEAVRLENFDVNDSVPIEEKILPTTRPFTSVYGDERSILDTPRNVTIVSREQLDTISIRDVRDFSKLTSSSYTTANFGAPANPSIRGMSADVFVNGIRRGLTSNGNGMPINFNSVESVNIVKGPATAVQGASQYTGGFVDLVTKRAYFDKPRGEVEGTIGSWDQRRWTVDYGSPLAGGKSAVRFSYSGEDSGSYYQFGKRITEALYTAYSWHPSDTYQLDANVEYYQADYTENFGINRPTQALIDHGLYVTNDPANPPYFSYGGPGSTPGSWGDVVPNGPLVKIDRSRRTLAPGDDSFGRTATAQVFQTWKPSAGGYKIVNGTTATWVDRDTFSSYIFSEVLKNHIGVDNRTEVQIETDKSSINVGVEERFQNILSYVSYYNESPNVYDLTQNPETRRFPADQLYSGTFAVPGEAPRGNLPFRPADTGGSYDPDVYYNGGNGDTGHSQLTQVGVFYQQDVHVTPVVDVLFGGRVDTLNVTWTDPLPAPGYKAKSDSTVAGLPSANASLIYALTPKTKAYLTYNYSQSTTLSNGGGYVPGNGVAFLSSEFHRVSQLVETGVKSSLLDDKLFVGAAVYAQEREIPGIGGGRQKVELGGFEAEANYQPSRNLWATIGYSFIDSTNVGGGGTFGAGQTARPIDQVFGNGVWTPIYAGPDDDARYQTPALPRHLLNALVTYKHSSGFGASAGITVTSPIPLAANYVIPGQVDTPDEPAIFMSAKIPTQYTVDLSVFYAQKAYEFRISVLNATDEKNWSPQVPFYGNDGVIAEEPISLQATAKYRF